MELSTPIGSDRRRGLAYLGAYRPLHRRRHLSDCGIPQLRDVFPDSWGWMLASGIVDLILAALIIKGWPSTASWALGLILGVNLFSSGLAVIMVALAGKTLVQTVAKAAPWLLPS
jgi:hypothetical protein